MKKILSFLKRDFYKIAWLILGIFFLNQLTVLNTNISHFNMKFSGYREILHYDLKQIDRSLNDISSNVLSISPN